LRVAGGALAMQAGKVPGTAGAPRRGPSAASIGLSRPPEPEQRPRDAPKPSGRVVERDAPAWRPPGLFASAARRAAAGRGREEKLRGLAVGGPRVGIFEGRRGLAALAQLIEPVAQLLALDLAGESADFEVG
jgi:hypothetical protein